MSLSAPASAQVPPSSPPPMPLSADVVVRREMAVGETHRYAIDLREGEYFQANVEQRGVDVVATVTAPGGTGPLETDCPCGPIGPEPIAFVAAADGVHELALKAVEVSIVPRGRYEIRVEAIRAPTSSDQLRVDAIRAGAEAVQARKTPRTALERRRAALAAWVALGDRRMELWTETEVAYLQAFDLDLPAQGEEPYRHALAAAVELRDEWAESRISDDLAQVLIRLGRMEETRALMERALALGRAAGRDQQVARMFTVLGSFFSLTGDPQAALERLYQALAVYEAAGNARDQARTQIEIGATYLRLGDAELALQHYEMALPAFASDPGRRARCITEMGVARLRLGDYAGARRAYDEALDIYRTLENPIAEADTLIGLADLYRNQGDLTAALKAATGAIERYRTRAYRPGIGFAQCRLGDIQRRLGNAALARAAFDEIVELGSRGFANSLACGERGLAILDTSAGALESAQRHAEAALARVESLRSVASPRSRTAALASRQSIFEVLVDILVRRHERQPWAGHDSAAFEVSERARARTLLDLLSEGRVDVSSGVSPELLSAQRSLRERLNAAAAAQSRAVRADGTSDAENRNREIDRLSTELADTESRIRTTSPGYAALMQAPPMTLSEIRARILGPDTQLLQYAVGEGQSYLFVVSADRLESFRLPPRAEIEEAALRLHRLLASGPTAGGTAQPSALPEALRALSALILAPATRALTARRLLVVAPGALQYVPYGSLSVDGVTPMLARFELVSAPSASVMVTLRDEARGRTRAAKVAAVFADPVFEQSDPRLADAGRGRAAPRARLASRGEGELQEAALRGWRGSLARLPFSRREADAITALAGRRASLQAIGFEASRSAATSPRLADYRIVHFATHAILNTHRPELTGVVLSLFDANGERQDGFLRLHDIYNLHLGADLVVLSGCQTALGKEVRGEGLIGLTRGFMYAGARTVVASLWQVDDESTAELMKHFYRGMLKENRRPADALRQAQLEMSRTKRWSAPFYWAGFVLQGDWR